jgi:uncharacterized protein (TIGR02271 family)
LISLISLELSMKQTVVGLFESDADARRAMQMLTARGTDPNHVEITHAQEQAGAGTGEQADTGMVNRVRNFFSGMFGPQDEPEVGHYAEALRRGGAVLKVDVDDDAQIEGVRDAFTTAGAVDIDQRIESWRAQGWGDGEAATVKSSLASTETAVDGPEDVIPVLQEELSVGKRRVSTGGLRVYARTVETPVTEDVQLRTEHAEVQRRVVDRPATTADLSGLQDRTIEVSETAEVPVVQKTARVVEEVRVGKTVEERTEEIADTVRSTEVEVERLDREPGAKTPSSRG